MTVRTIPLAEGPGAWLVLAVWLLGSIGTLWCYELRDWRPFSIRADRLFEIDRAQTDLWFRLNMAAPANGSRPATLTLVHLYNPDCRCDAYTQRHLQRLMDRYQSQGVRFVAALTPRIAMRATLPHPLGIRTIASADRLLAAGGATAPAALIFDAAGRLIYYGPYSDSAWCGSEGGLVEPVLDRALAGQKPVDALPVIRGCFCPW